MNFEFQRVTNDVFTYAEVNGMIQSIDENKDNLGFGIRNFLENNPRVLNRISKTAEFLELVKTHFKRPRIIKSIYFDKPKKANWVVNWHQDITVNLSRKLDRNGYSNWRVLKDRVVVQPPEQLLRSILTYRIHLDDTTELNGALKVILCSEDQGIMRLDKNYINSTCNEVEVCNDGRGGVLTMSPLTVHASQRSMDSQKRRRVIHLEVIEVAGNIEDLPWRENYALC
ncbi:phytanoyl-CoA dioxygenase family protein [Lewinella sp. JB7]|uniref:phytanoyl-CoA dioxygenase family protein n=1 Tax=Lewinella sp. JB7 TaxID=2962887 RepID=UPI0020C94F55|nr:phytanoyl-CoA dioxygenase family protein [Lewinella sp. JB7]MCP9237948.1 phytanoyl-CoA dioxygenase family protein [Lewinella sp. JB7]